MEGLNAKSIKALESRLFSGLDSRIGELKTLIKQNQEVTESKLMSRKSVLGYFGISVSTLDRWCKNGTLKPYGVEGRVYFKRAEVESVMIAIG